MENAKKVIAYTAAGAAIVTVIGYLVDGDGTFVLQNEDKTITAVVQSDRGGLFAHQHGLTVVKYDETNYLHLFSLKTPIFINVCLSLYFYKSDK